MSNQKDCACSAAPKLIFACSLDCVKGTLEQAGFNDFHHIHLTDLGVEKGKSAVNEENIGTAAKSARERLSLDQKGKDIE